MQPFHNPPLALTVLEIRYSELADGLGVGAQRAIKAAVQDRLPLMERIKEEQVQVNLAAAATTSVRHLVFPRFHTRDRTTALLVKEDALILETTDYKGWRESFRPLIAEVTNALGLSNPPDGIKRIGLRYIDEVRIPNIDTVPGNWEGYINRHLLAAAAPEVIPASMQLSVWQGLVQYRTAHASTLTVRYGPQEGYAVRPDGLTRRKNPPNAGLYFLLDSDCFLEATDEVPEYDAKLILERCDLLHAPVSEFFKTAVTEKLRDEVFNRE